MLKVFESRVPFWLFLFNFLSSDLFNLSANGDSFPELNTALADTVNATQVLVTKFVQLDDQKLALLRSESFLEYQATKNEVFLDLTILSYPNPSSLVCGITI